MVVLGASLRRAIGRERQPMETGRYGSESAVPPIAEATSTETSPSGAAELTAVIARNTPDKTHLSGLAEPNLVVSTSAAMPTPRQGERPVLIVGVALAITGIPEIRDGLSAGVSNVERAFRSRLMLRPSYLYPGRFRAGTLRSGVPTDGSKYRNCFSFGLSAWRKR